jgi:hypothetical protein
MSILAIVAAATLAPAAWAAPAPDESGTAVQARTETGGRPPFARRYVGTATGSFRYGERQRDTWRVTGLTFQLTYVRLARGLWGGIYSLRGGQVAYRSTGNDGAGCTYSVERTFRIPRGPSNRIAFAETTRPPGFAYVGTATSRPTVPVTWTCADGATRSDTVSPGSWWITGVSRRFRPGGPLRGSETNRDYEPEIWSWAWNLRPAR